MRDAAYSQAPTIGFTRKTLRIPAFAYASTWSGVSFLLARYSIGNTNPFSFKRPIVQPNESFVAAVSWSESPYVYRYKLAADIGEVLYFPTYRDYQIGVGAYLEIWSVAGSALASTAADWTLYTSQLVLPTLCGPCQENTEEVTGVAETLSSLPPYQYCNPFCTPLCTPSA